VIAVPGPISKRRGAPIHQVTDDPWTETASLGLIGFIPALESP
jgi:hypothetical protein